MEERQEDERCRVVIENVSPEIDCGRFAIKRVVGESVVVEADVFADGHDQVACQVLYGHGANPWQSSPMTPLGNDRWRGKFPVERLGCYRYTVEGWIDPFRTWLVAVKKQVDAGQDVQVELLTGAALIEEVVKRASRDDAEGLRQWAAKLREAKKNPLGDALNCEETLIEIVARYPLHSFASRYTKELSVGVDGQKARFSTWYEVFPRSCSREPGRHGTFRDCEQRLPYIASMGFDVVYLPPIHPIGVAFRKGKNNSEGAKPGDVGSPWAVGAAEGGHKSIHPQLGTLGDFKRFVATAGKNGLDVALDIALQCSPDHPYVGEHREWFRSRPDGTIQYAENPPKKYQDIYPLDFETEDLRALWNELKSIFDYWIEQGVRIFRVDNPHTKPFAFWEWLIAAIKKDHPDVIFLAEAFTKPLVMQRLAKLGFSQSYTYFTWRNTKQELTDYVTELTQTEIREYFRPNFWPNTPDILPEFLQRGGRPAFMIRLILAATLAASYGVYGAAFELCENVARQPGSEEYLNSEKYELKNADLESAQSLKDLITRINRIRRENPALQSNDNVQFHRTDNPLLICYSKATRDLADVIIVVVNLDYTYRQSGWVDLDLASLGLDGEQAFQVHDLLGEGTYSWRGARSFVELTPGSLPAHILRVRRRVRTEHDFDYYV
jgi:starch synthase (maltosyl-transferring)